MIAIFAFAAAEFEKLHHGMLLSEVNNAINDRPLLLAPMTIDAGDAVL